MKCVVAVAFACSCLVVPASAQQVVKQLPSLFYFNEADRGGHFAMWEYPELFATELRAAFTSLRTAAPARKG